jgi:DNA replication protein DnaC
MCLCKCAAEQRDREEAERQRQKFEEKIRELRKAGFPDEEMQNWTFAHDDHANERVSAIARNYVEHFPEMKQEGKGLVFFGNVGTGKTFVAACIANALIDKGRPCMVTNFARLINTITGMYEGKQQYIDSLNNFHLLVIDDFAVERNTEYVNEIVYNIIDSRYRAGLPLIITTNLTANELKNPADMAKKRIYSRLYDMCLMVEVQGEDRRRAHLKEDYARFHDLLGI